MTPDEIRNVILRNLGASLRKPTWQTSGPTSVCGSNWTSTPWTSELHHRAAQGTSVEIPEKTIETRYAPRMHGYLTSHHEVVPCEEGT
jgi:hypothetical protein